MEEIGVSSVLALLLMIILSIGDAKGNPEVEALLAFAKNLKANKFFSTWLVSSGPCRWVGVTCNAHGTVMALRIHQCGLQGPLSPVLGNLKSMETLDLSNNVLSGPIPPEIGNMASLTSLNLRYNRLTGVPPPELNKLSNLESLLLNDNLFKGCLPLSEWRQLLMHLLHVDVSNTPSLQVSENCSRLH